MSHTITVEEIEAQADALEAAGYHLKAVSLRNQWLTKDRFGRTKLAREPRTYQTEADVVANIAAGILAELEAYEDARRRAEEARENGKAEARKVLQAIAEGRAEATKAEVYDLANHLNDGYYTMPKQFTVTYPTVL